MVCLHRFFVAVRDCFDAARIGFVGPAIGSAFRAGRNSIHGCKFDFFDAFAIDRAYRFKRTFHAFIVPIAAIWGIKGIATSLSRIIRVFDSDDPLAKRELRGSDGPPMENSATLEVGATSDWIV